MENEKHRVIREWVNKIIYPEITMVKGVKQEYSGVTDVKFDDKGNYITVKSDEPGILWDSDFLIHTVNSFDDVDIYLKEVEGEFYHFKKIVESEDFRITFARRIYSLRLPSFSQLVEMGKVAIVFNCKKAYQDYQNEISPWHLSYSESLEYYCFPVYEYWKTEMLVLLERWKNQLNPEFEPFKTHSFWIKPKPLDPRIDPVEELYQFLYSNSFVPPSSKNKFRGLFSNRKYIDPMRWMGSISALHFLVQKIPNQFTDGDYYHVKYQVASKYFLDKNGNFISPEHLRNSNYRGKEAETIISFLNDSLNGLLKPEDKKDS